MAPPAPASPRVSNTRFSLLAMMLVASLVACTAAADGGEGTCGASTSPQQHLYDITATIRAELPVWLQETGLGDDHRTMVTSHKKGDKVNASMLRFNAHTGTHIDAPRHFVTTDPTGIDDIPLDVINGPALLLEAFGVEALTAEVLSSLDIPTTGVSRVLFRTENTRRGLMGQTAFAPNYVGFSTDGAAWLVKHRPEVKAVGIDYLSIARLVDLGPGHLALLGAGIVPIEGLVLPEHSTGNGGGGISAGWWFLHCAPLKLEGSDGAPARAWLTPMMH